jgi:hypothetical protein
MKEIAFAVNKDGLVPPLEDVAHTSVQPIAALRVDPVQLAHAPGESIIQGFNDQVIVVGHQAVAIAQPSHPPADLTEDMEERLSVPIIQVNRCTAIATGGDMIHRTRKLSAQWSRHIAKYCARL